MVTTPKMRKNFRKLQLINESFLSFYACACGALPFLFLFSVSRTTLQQTSSRKFVTRMSPTRTLTPTRSKWHQQLQRDSANGCWPWRNTTGEWLAGKGVGRCRKSWSHVLNHLHLDSFAFSFHSLAGVLVLLKSSYWPCGSCHSFLPTADFSLSFASSSFHYHVFFVCLSYLLRLCHLSRRVAKVVAPKREKLKAAQADLSIAMKVS